MISGLDNPIGEPVEPPFGEPVHWLVSLSNHRPVEDLKNPGK
jgi:hypothetical protein